MERPTDFSAPPPGVFESNDSSTGFSGQKRDAGGAFVSSYRKDERGAGGYASGPGAAGGGGGFNSSDSSVKLFVGSVPKTIQEDEVRPLFEEFGSVLEVALIKDRATGAQRGCCFVKFGSVEEAERAVKGLNNRRTLPGSTTPVQVRFADGERERLGIGGLVEYKLFVGSLNKNLVEKEIEDIFAPFGPVDDVYIMRDAEKLSRGCAFVKYSSKEAAERAISNLHGTFKCEGSEQLLTVRYADPKRPRANEARVGGPGAPYGGGPGGYPGPGGRSSQAPVMRQEERGHGGWTSGPSDGGYRGGYGGPGMGGPPQAVQGGYYHGPPPGYGGPPPQQQPPPQAYFQHPASQQPPQQLQSAPMTQQPPATWHSAPAPLAQAPPPAAAPAASCDWSEHTAPDGYKYYYNAASQESKWDKPPELVAFEASQQRSVPHGTYQQVPPQQTYGDQQQQQSSQPLYQQMPAQQQALYSQVPAQQGFSAPVSTGSYVAQPGFSAAPSQGYAQYMNPTAQPVTLVYSQPPGP